MSSRSRSTDGQSSNQTIPDPPIDTHAHLDQRGSIQRSEGQEFGLNHRCACVLAFLVRSNDRSIDRSVDSMRRCRIGLGGQKSATPTVAIKRSRADSPAQKTRVWSQNWRLKSQSTTLRKAETTWGISSLFVSRSTEGPGRKRHGWLGVTTTDRQEPCPAQVSANKYDSARHTTRNERARLRRSRSR